MKFLYQTKLNTVQEFANESLSHLKLFGSRSIRDMIKRINFHLNLAKLSDDMKEPVLYYQGDSLGGASYHIGYCLVELLAWCDINNISVEVLLNAVCQDITANDDKVKTVVTEFINK